MWKKTADNSGSRNLLILHRALEYVTEFLGNLGRLILFLYCHFHFSIDVNFLLRWGFSIMIPTLTFLTSYGCLDNIEEDEKCTAMSQKAYETTLMKHHPWVVQVSETFKPFSFLKNLRFKFQNVFELQEISFVLVYCKLPGIMCNLPSYTFNQE